MTPFDLPKRHYNYDEIAQWPDDARRELDDGTPILLYAPGLCPVIAHSHCTTELMFALQCWNKNERHGELIFLVDWQLDEYNSVAPDLSFYRDKPRVRADGQCFVSAPDLTIEVWDERTNFNDTIRKPALYARYNIPTFWLVNPQLQTVLVHRNPTPNGYADIEQLARGAILIDESLPDFRLPLAQLFD